MRRLFLRNICLVLLAAGMALADNSKISPDLLPLLSNPSATHSVIVQYKPPTLLGGVLGGLLGGILGNAVNTVFSLISAVTSVLTGSDIAGIVAGNGSVSAGPGGFRTYKGIAPNARLLDLRVLDANGVSSDTVLIAAIQRAVELKQQYNVRVINLSVGRPVFESCSLDPLCKAVEAAWANGIVVVTAAGNFGRNGYATVLSPGNSPHAITVGAMKTMDTASRTDDAIASYSSKGPTYI